MSDKSKVQSWMTGYVEAVWEGCDDDWKRHAEALLAKHYAARKVPYRYDTKRIGDCLQTTGKPIPEAALALASEVLSYHPETEQEDWLARNLAPVFHRIAELEAMEVDDEPLLAVVRAAINEHGTCALCWMSRRSDGHLDTCPVPAALEAMEVDDE